MLSFLLNWVARYFPYKSLFKREKTLAPQPSRKKAPTIVSQLSPDSSPYQGLQAEIRAERQFSLAEAIGRESGSFMKGESAIPRPIMAANTIRQFIVTQSLDPSGGVATELVNWSVADIRFSCQLDTPLVALTQIVESLLNEPTTFYEFARQVAITQAKITGDRPYFQQPGQPPHPEAEYTHRSISQYLLEIAQLLEKPN